MESALQDLVKVCCYGCGALNAHGLQIKSFWAGDDVVCAWRPQPYHIGYPGIVYGGIIASVVDCHCIWTASAHAHRAAGIEMKDTLRFPYVTGGLTVNYRRPVPIGEAIDLRARVAEFGERKALVRCSVNCQGVLCAEAEVVAVRMPVPERAAPALAS